MPRDTRSELRVRSGARGVLVVVAAAAGLAAAGWVLALLAASLLAG